MYILLDIRRMAILYRCEKVETLRALANIELSYTPVAVLEEAHVAAYSHYTIENLQELFRNLTGGTNPHSHNGAYLVGQIIRLCQTAQPCNVDNFEVTVQSLQIKPRDKDFYRYAKGQSKPKFLEEPYEPPPLLGNWQAAQGLPLPSAQTAPATPVQAPRNPQPWAVQPVAADAPPPKYAPPWV